MQRKICSMVSSAALRLLDEIGSQLAGRSRRVQERILAESEESDNRHQALISALDVLNERERRIFEARRLADDPITLEDLASEFGVSRERVRQIEVRAFEKVQKASQKPYGCDGTAGRNSGDWRTVSKALYP